MLGTITYLVTWKSKIFKLGTFLNWEISFFSALRLWSETRVQGYSPGSTSWAPPIFPTGCSSTDAHTPPLLPSTASFLYTERSALVHRTLFLGTAPHPGKGLRTATNYIPAHSQEPFKNQERGPEVDIGSLATPGSQAFFPIL